MIDNDYKMLANIKTDKVKEKDLTDFLNQLRASRGLSDFVTACVRVCWDKPELLRSAGYTTNLSCMTTQRLAFFQKQDRMISELYNKINTIYDMAFKNYVLAEFGNRMNIGEKAKAILAAQFELQRCTQKIEMALGVGSVTDVWESNKQKMEETAKMADEILEYIIHSYTSITDELRGSASSGEDMRSLVEALKEVIANQPVQIATQQNQVCAQSTITNYQLNNTGITNNAGQNTQETTSKYENMKEISSLGDEPQRMEISEDADWGALDAFIGD